MLRAPRAQWTTYHNIIGVVPRKSFLGRVTEDGDGVVSAKSAKIDGVASEIAVAADHLEVHRHPLAILEVRRILLEHIHALSGTPRFATAPPAVPLAPSQPFLPDQGAFTTLR